MMRIRSRWKPISAASSKMYGHVNQDEGEKRERQRQRERVWSGRFDERGGCCR